MPSPKSLANLHPYKPGENGHHFGIGYNLTERLRHSLDKPLKELKDDAPVAERIVHSWIEGTILREPTPFKETLERIDGKVSDTHAILGDIVIKVIYEERKVVIDAESGLPIPP